MKVAIILGNRMNDDGTISATMKKRLDLTIELFNELKPDKIIVSGGIANEVANVSEASKMEEYLLSKGIDKDLIIQENKSHTTRENALFSVPIAESLNRSYEAFDKKQFAKSCQYIYQQSQNIQTILLESSTSIGQGRKK